MSTTLTIARREFRSNFDSPLAYVVICLGLIMLGSAAGMDKAVMKTLFAAGRLPIVPHLVALRREWERNGADDPHPGRALPRPVIRSPQTRAVAVRLLQPTAMWRRNRRRQTARLRHEPLWRDVRPLRCGGHGVCRRGRAGAHRCARGRRARGGGAARGAWRRGRGIRGRPAWPST